MDARSFLGEIIDGVMGRGATDMKSGVAAFCGAMAQLVADGGLENGTVSLAITNDEEADAVNGTKKLLEWATSQGHKFDFAIVGEPSSFETFGDSIKIGRRGSLSGRITVSGKQGRRYPQRQPPMPVPARLVEGMCLSTPNISSPQSKSPPSTPAIRLPMSFPQGGCGPTSGSDTWRDAQGRDRAPHRGIRAQAAPSISRSWGRSALPSPARSHVAHLCEVMERSTARTGALQSGHLRCAVHRGLLPGRRMRADRGDHAWSMKGCRLPMWTAAGLYAIFVARFLAKGHEISPS